MTSVALTREVSSVGYPPVCWGVEAVVVPWSQVHHAVKECVSLLRHQDVLEIGWVVFVWGENNR